MSSQAQSTAVSSNPTVYIHIRLSEIFKASSEDTVYNRLLEVYKASSEEEAKNLLTQLPIDLQNKIYGIINELANSPQNVEWNPGAIHACASLSRLQEAVQRIAFTEFDSLTQEEKNIVGGKVYHNAGSPQTTDLRWGEHHAKDDVEVLLKSLDSYSIDPTTDLKKILDSWAIAGTPEEWRQEAKERIFAFINDTSSKKLNLEYLNLKSLPSIFHKAPFISRLSILSVRRNQLTELPPEIDQCQALQCLDVFDNQLTALLPEIGLCKALLELDVSDNQLIALPQEIGQCRALQWLDIYDNRLTALPPTIGQCRTLRVLNVSNNPLTTLPNEILQLHHDCTVNLTGSSLSQHILGNLRTITSSPGYNGPTIHGPTIHSMMEESRFDRSMEELLTELFELAGKPKKEFPKLMANTRCSCLHTWLDRLNHTADFKAKGERQKNLAIKILRYLEMAEEDSNFQGEFFNIIEDAAETCGDRMSLSILYVGLAHKLLILDKTNLKDLADFLIKGVWTIELLGKMAKDKVAKLPFVEEEIEVYLGYPVKLKDVLGIPIDVEDMLYFQCSNLTQEDLDKAEAAVKEEQYDDEKKCSFLISQPKWIEALRGKYLTQMKQIDSDIEAETDKLVSIEAKMENKVRNEKYDELGKLRNEKLMALTAWALCDVV